MRIDFSKATILALADQRDKRQKPKYLRQEESLIARMNEACGRGFMTKDDLIATAAWKWRGARTQQLCGNNYSEDVEEISRHAFSTASERLRIGALLSLEGVGWPMASVILHFVFPNIYPILDVNAMKSVGGSTHYNFAKWSSYTDLCQQNARRLDVSLRTLDKALWAFDKGSQ